MNCSDVRTRLTSWLHDEVNADDRARLEQHLTACPACRREAESLRHAFSLLDRVPVPAVAVDLPRLYREAAEYDRRRARRWRRTALVLVGVAAGLLLVLGLRLEVRVEAHQVTLRWGTPPAAAPTPPTPPTPAVAAALEPSPAGTPEQMLVVRELIHALATDVDVRDRRRQDDLLRLQEVWRRLNSRLTETERHLAAMQAAQLVLIQKGGER
jgi:anti-sigma factor RsiW